MSFEESTCRRKREALRRTSELSHQEVFRLAKVEEILDGTSILFGEVVAVRAIKRLGLLEWRNLLVGDEELEVAAVVIRQDQHLIARGFGLTNFNCSQASGVYARRRSDLDDGLFELPSVFCELRA